MVGRILKEIRGEDKQQQLALELNIARETVSKYETGRSKIPADISRNLIEKFDDPRFAITVRHEYTRTGPRWLDGPNVDLHRASVKEKFFEEMQEALDAVNSISFANPLNNVCRSKKESVAIQIGQAIIAGEILLAVLCKEGDISYLGVWETINVLLAKAGYITGGAK